MKRVFFATTALLALTSCAGSSTKPASKETPVQEESSAILTRSAVAKSEVVNMEESFMSEIIAYKDVDITPAASGVRISDITVDVGDKVTKGQRLVSLDPTRYNQQMITVKTLQNDYERLKTVYKAGGISLQTLDQAKMNYKVQSEIADDLKKNIEILSPISGVVTQRNSEVGNLFTNQPILHISQIDKLKVLVDISEQFFPSVKVGMPVGITLDIYPDRLFEGRVSLIHPALNASSRTFTVEVTLPNTENLLRPGMHARSKFNMGTKPGILVPDIAVQKQFGSAENYIFVVKDGRAVRRTVNIGRQVGSYIDILSGVEVGEEVIITAFSRIEDGTEVSIKK